MIKKFNKELYTQAKTNVILYEKERIQSKTQKEYEHLVYESQKRKANKKTMKKLLKLYKTAVETSGWHHGQVMHIIRERLKEVIETGIYHPEEIKSITLIIILKKTN